MDNLVAKSPLFAVTGAGAPTRLYFENRKFDIFFFQISGLLCLLLIIPYLTHGPVVVFPIYNIYLIFFGLPHNYLTWVTIFPNSARKTFQMKSVYKALAFCAGLCLLLPFVQHLELKDWILSFVSYYSFWHAYRQHIGICKVYDTIQVKRTGDKTLFEDRKAMDTFFGLVVLSVILWAFSRPHITYLLSSTESFKMIYPQIPAWMFQASATATIGWGFWAVKRSIWDRRRQGKFIPWPQWGLIAVATLTYALPYFFMPIEAMPLAIAITTMFHNIQYFAFVWLFEKHRSQEFAQNNVPMQLPQRLAHRGSWKTYFGFAMAYSGLVIGIFLMVPSQVGLSFIYFLGISHYIIDGYIWRHSTNANLGVFLNRMLHSGS